MIKLKDENTYIRIQHSLKLRYTCSIWKDKVLYPGSGSQANRHWAAPDASHYAFHLEMDTIS